MKMNNCRIGKHLPSSGKVKTQQDSKSCCFRNSGHPGDASKDTTSVDVCLHCLISLSGGLDLIILWNPSLLADSKHKTYLITFLNVHSIASVNFVEITHLQCCHIWMSFQAPHCLVPLHGAPLPNLFLFLLLNVVKFKVSFVLLSLTFGSQWANGASLLAMREWVRQRETVGESVCAAARWCV